MPSMSQKKLKKLADKVCDACVCPIRGRLSPFSIINYIDDNIDADFPVIEIAPAPGELIGGEFDGKPIFDPPTIDFEQLRAIFKPEKDDDFDMSLQSPECECPPFVQVWTKKVMVKIYLAPMEDTPVWGIDTEKNCFVTK